jgi:TonB-linked SusC/RagA family outer membrane protein
VQLKTFPERAFVLKQLVNKARFTLELIQIHYRNANFINLASVSAALPALRASDIGNYILFYSVKVLKNMKRHLTLTLTWLCLSAVFAFGQKTVKGTVTSTGGEPLIGVNVLEVGTSVGTITDEDGSYSIRVTSDAATLEFSYTGYETQRVSAAGLTTLNINMQEGVKLEEVVITALGISREKKALTYSAQTVSGDQVNTVRDGNFVNTLSGKVAGLQVSQSASGPGGQARVVLRGNRSLYNNNALFVIDGVPVDNSAYGSVGSDFGGYSGTDGAVNINPDDIDNISVLKGAAAAALYGSRAANGVIMITTKKGKAGKLTVDVNSGVSWENALIFPTFQNEYSQGNGGAYAPTAAGSWGEKMNGQSVTNYLGNTQSLTPQPDNVKNFFETARSLNNAIGITTGNDKIQTYFSYANSILEGIIPNNQLDRHNLNLRIGTQISERFSTDAKLTYIHQQNDHKVKSGEENAVVQNIFLIPRSVSLDDVKNYTAPDAFGQPTPLYWTSSSIYTNPYWVTDLTNVADKRDRVIGLLSATYKLTDWLKVMGRGSVDRYQDAAENIFYDKTVLWAQQGGRYEKSFGTFTEQNFELLLMGDKALNESFSLTYTLGTGVNKRKLETSYAIAAGLLIPNKFGLDFARNLQSGNDLIEREIQAVFGTVQLAYNNYLYLDLTGRNDWSSTLPADNRSYFYPSVGLTAIVSEMVDLPEAISFGKIRASYTRVGNDAAPYLINQTYSFSQGGANGFINRDGLQPAPDLKPELTTSLELGLDWRFFNNRLGLDLTFYKTNTVNQLLVLSLPAPSGFSSKYINAGDIENKGIELSLNYMPVKNNKFDWNVTLNFARNTNEIIELDEQVKQSFLAGGYGRTAGPVVAEGGSFGDMYTLRWANAEDANGNAIYDPNGGKRWVDASGKPIVTAASEKIGNFNPDYTLGLNNSFNIGKFFVSFLIDGRKGGVVVSGTDANMAFYGNADYTTAFREGSWVLDAVTRTGETNSTAINAESFWTTVSGGRYSWGEFFTYDATNFRLRELTAGYSFGKAAFFNDIRLSLVARNLFFFYRGKALLDMPGVPERKMNFDPDVSLGGAGNFQGVEYGNIPSSRSIGLNLKLSF